MNSRSILCAGLALAGMMAAQGAGAQEDLRLYMADPAAAAVFGHTVGETPGPATLFSGEISFLAWNYADLSEQEAVFDIGGELVLLDRTAGTLEKIYESGAVAPFAALDTGPGADEITLVLVSGNTLQVVRGTRSGGVWTFADFGPAITRLSNSTVDITRLGDGTLVLMEGHINSGYLAPVTESGVGTPVAEGVLTNSFLTRGPGNQVIVHTYRNDTPTTIYDSGLVLARTILPGDAGAFEGGTSAIDWQATSPEISVVAREGIRTGNDPLAGTLTSSPAFSFLTGGVVDPERDLSGATYIRRTGASSWRVFHGRMGTTHDVNGATQSLAQDIVIGRGSGPAFHLIVDIAAAPDGTVYVLDRGLTNTRLIAVDPIWGDREVVGNLGEPFELLEVTADGTILLAKEAVEVQSVNTGTGTMDLGQRMQKIVSVTLTGDPNAPAIAPVAAGALDAGVASFAAAEAAQPRLLTYPNHGRLVLKTASTDLVPTAALAWEGAMSFVSGMSPKYMGTVNVTSAVAQPERLTIAVSRPGIWSTTLWTSSNRQLRITAPDASVRTINAGIGTVRIEGGTSRVVFAVTLDASSIANIAGTWTVEALEVYDSTITGVTAHVIADSALHGRHIQVAGDGSVLLYEAFPPAIVEYDEDTGVATRTAITLPPASHVGADLLNRATDFLLAPDGQSAYVALLDVPAVLQVDLATGDAMPVVLGRPATIDAELLAINDSSILRLAIGAAGVTTGTQNWWLY